MVTPTRWRVLLTVALLTGAVVYAVTRVWSSRSSMLPGVPIGAAVVIALLGVAVLLTALTLRGRFQHKPGREPVPPLAAARLVVVAKTASHAGALLAGAYAGLFVFYLFDLDTEIRTSRMIASVACVGAAVLLVVAGLVLERLCRIPEDRERRDEREPPAAA